jgi:hypothetical protein
VVKRENKFPSAGLSFLKEGVTKVFVTCSKKDEASQNAGGVIVADELDFQRWCLNHEF